jgi:hypothetical protein
VYRRLDKGKWEMLQEWDEARWAPKRAAWMHDGSVGTKYAKEALNNLPMAHCSNQKPLICNGIAIFDLI